MTRRPSRRLRGRRDGFILFIALVFTSLLAVGSILAVTGTLGAVLSAGNELRDKRAFFAADGSAALCRGELRNRLLVALPAQLGTVPNIATITPYVPDDPAGVLVQYAYQSTTSLGGALVRDSATQAHLNITYSPSGAPRPYTCTLILTSRIPPKNVNLGTPPPIYLFRFLYTITGTVADGNASRQVNLQGTFSILLQNDNFARYALFTSTQGNVWFTNRTNYSGPVHTNGEFNFANNPGALFTEIVTSVNTMAKFYNGGSSIELDADQNGSVDVPVFSQGITRGVDTIPMPALTTGDRQREAALGIAQGASYSGYGTGVHLGASGGAMAGGIYVKADASISLGVSGNAVVFTITQGDTTTTVTANKATNQTTIRIGAGSVTTYTGVPNGMFFVDGQVASLDGTLQKDTELTIAATNDVIISNNVMYENFTPGTTPSAEGTTNLLGIMSWSGNVGIATTAPNDISVHATVMTPFNEFHVDNYNSGSSRGSATVLGGVIENTYGPFGTFGGSTTGYGRNFIYDMRMRKGKSPPFFPTIGRVLSTVTGLNDRPNWQQIN